MIRSEIMVRQSQGTKDSVMLPLNEEYEETVASLKAEISKFWVSIVSEYVASIGINIFNHYYHPGEVNWIMFPGT